MGENRSAARLLLFLPFFAFVVLDQFADGVFVALPGHGHVAVVELEAADFAEAAILSHADKLAAVRFDRDGMFGTKARLGSAIKTLGLNLGVADFAEAALAG